MSAPQKVEIHEYRGVEDLVYAKVTKDDATGYETGDVKSLAGVATVQKSTAVSTATHYYDNVPAIVISATGADTITIGVSAIPLEIQAELSGNYYDETTGAMIEGEPKHNYFAVGYKTKKENNDYVYVWRYKGMWTQTTDTEHNTEDDGTDANGQEIVFTGVNTNHKFTKTGETAKGLVVDVAAGLADVSAFFDTVTTPDTLQAKS